MITNLTKQDLIDFEEDILRCFENKEIRSPIHLSNGDEDQLIDIFQNIRKQDWVCSTWRSHYHCLLKGVPFEELKKKILDGHSISLCFKDYKIISSAIVGGICPIALGLAWAAKELEKDEKIFCFIGDMAATTGIFHECYEYSIGHDLPIVWIIANNNKSVCTPTSQVWGYDFHPFANSTTYDFRRTVTALRHKIMYYNYQHTFSHAGGKTRVNF